jgi:putative transposase
VLGLIDEAVAAGARQAKACEVLGIDSRTIQRWKKQGIGGDRRAGPKTPPKNKLSEAERRKVLEVVNSPEFRDRSPKQIVPYLADRGVYIASESSIYRILREEGQLSHRAASQPPTRRRPDELVATDPNQVWSWDITYLKSPILGVFFYLYLIVDIFSRKIVAAQVHTTEDAEHAAELVALAYAAEDIGHRQLKLHSDNGAPMRGATLLATLQQLGVAPSYSRPRVSDDNPYSEALFRTAKYRPEYPTRAFESLEAAREWVQRFVHWYNNEHRHSGIGFVTPAQRHSGDDVELLARRHRVYQAARDRNPERWSTNTRDWSRVEAVRLNPDHGTDASEAA